MYIITYATPIRKRSKFSFGFILKNIEVFC